jgi:site-specific recombinase XerC
MTVASIPVRRSLKPSRPVQLLGHENLETTAIYTEVNIRQLQEVHPRCHPSGRLASDHQESYVEKA